MSVLVLTPTRVLIFGTSTASVRFALTQQVNAWPRSAVTATKERVELHTNEQDGSPTHSLKVLRLSLRTPDGELGADPPAGERASRQVAKELTATKRSG